MLETVLDVLFPRRCAACGRGAYPFCGDCAANVLPIVPPLCDRCGGPVDLPVPVCGECPPGQVRTARAPFVFEGSIRRAIHRLKFAGDRSVAAALSAAMVAVSPFEPDVVTWVPLSRSRLVERGYDQARALARSFAGSLGFSMTSLLRRTSDSGPQARRSAHDRRVAMKGTYEATAPAPPSVLLIDDVLTTGITVSECARVLREAGARRVDVLTAARAVTSRYARTGSRPGLWLPGDPLR
jgi:ComF family protein